MANIFYFVDAENDDCRHQDKVLSLLRQQGRLQRQVAFADWTNHSQSAQNLSSLGFELLHTPAGNNGRKDIADKALLVDITRTAMQQPGEFVIALASGDFDFSPVAPLIKRQGGALWGFSRRAVASRDLIRQTDTFYFTDTHPFEVAWDASMAQVPEPASPSVPAPIHFNGYTFPVSTTEELVRLYRAVHRQMKRITIPPFDVRDRLFALLCSLPAQPYRACELIQELFAMAQREQMFVDQGGVYGFVRTCVIARHGILDLVSRPDVDFNQWIIQPGATVAHRDLSAMRFAVSSVYMKGLFDALPQMPRSVAALAHYLCDRIDAVSLDFVQRVLSELSSSMIRQQLADAPVNSISTAFRRAYVADESKWAHAGRC